MGFYDNDHAISGLRHIPVFDFVSVRGSCRTIYASIFVTFNQAYSSLIRHLLFDLHWPQTKPTPTRTDNQGVKIQATKAVNHATAKHFRISQAYIRSKGDDGTVEVQKVSTTMNHSDFLTKALGTELFVRHRDAVMGPQHPPGMT